jgi:hypothetical protein
MSLKTRLKRSEKDKANNRLWAFIGIGKPQSPLHQRLLEIQARNNYYATGGDKNAYLTFLPFDSFGIGFIGYVAKSELTAMIMDKTKNPAESSCDSHA